MGRRIYPNIPLKRLFAPMTNPNKEQQLVVRWIVLAIMAWGIYHAIGAYRLNHHPMRPVMVLVCVGGFLGWWLLLLKFRRAKLAKKDKEGR
jgi:hypothetical protein